MSDTHPTPLAERKKTFRNGIVIIEELRELAESQGNIAMAEAARRAAAMLRAWFEVVNERDAKPMSDNDEVG